MAQLILKELQRARRQSKLPWRALCGDVPYATFMRWKKRAAAGEALLLTRGPKKQSPMDLEQLYWLIASLPHGCRRTRGTEALCRQLADQVSRRLIRQIAKQIRHQHMNSLCRIQWLLTGTAWTIDGTQYAHDCTIIPVQDLASKYRLPPLLSRREHAEQIAAHLDELFAEYGPPLFLKRDNGSPFNADAVDEILRRHVVIPLNNPPYYPRYNGSMERNIRELKSALRQRCRPDRPFSAVLKAELEATVHGLNHKPIRALHGQTPCGRFHDPRRALQFTRRQREQILRLLLNAYRNRLAKMSNPTQPQCATLWRRTVESWLRCQGLIKVGPNQNQKPNVSTNSTKNWSHN